MILLGLSYESLNSSLEQSDLFFSPFCKIFFVLYFFCCQKLQFGIFITFGLFFFPYEITNFSFNFSCTNSDFVTFWIWATHEALASLAKSLRKANILNTNLTTVLYFTDTTAPFNDTIHIKRRHDCERFSCLASFSRQLATSCCVSMRRSKLMLHARDTNSLVRILFWNLLLKRGHFALSC